MGLCPGEPRISRKIDRETVVGCLGGDHWVPRSLIDREGVTRREPGVA